MGTPSSAPLRILGRYALHGEIASGGMATVHFGRLLGVVGFSKTVAIKRLHAQYSKDPEFVSMFLDEARLAARIRHPNVVSTLDVVALEGQLFLVMEYVQGESIRHLVNAARDEHAQVPPAIVATILTGTLHGLHAAHEAKNERGDPLGIVHRDVSPQNILVGVDGVPRVLDFGVAKAAGRIQTTRDGQVKGKIAYMSPEQIMGRSVTRATDVFAASIVLWEALTGRRLFGGASEGEVLHRLLDAQIDPPGKYVTDLPPQLDAIVVRGLSREPADRFPTARDMARALERAVHLAPASEVGEFVERMAGPALKSRSDHIARIESTTPDFLPDSVDVPVDTPASGTEPASPPASGDWSSVSNATSTAVSEGEAFGLVDRRRRMRRIAAIVLGGAGAVILVAIGIVLGTRREPVTTSTVAPPVTILAPGAAPPAPPSAPPLLATPPAPSASAPAQAGVPPASAAPTAVVARPATQRPAARPTAPRVDCNPPYTVDDQGFRHYKRDCAP